MFLILATFLAATIEGVAMMAILVGVGRLAAGGPLSWVPQPASLFSPD
jgi:hypothetical protein